MEHFQVCDPRSWKGYKGFNSWERCSLGALLISKYLQPSPGCTSGCVPSLWDLQENLEQFGVTGGWLKDFWDQPSRKQRLFILTLIPFVGRKRDLGQIHTAQLEQLWDQALPACSKSLGMSPQAGREGAEPSGFAPHHTSNDLRRGQSPKQIPPGNS